MIFQVFCKIEKAILRRIFIQYRFKRLYIKQGICIYSVVLYTILCVHVLLIQYFRVLAAGIICLSCDERKVANSGCFCNRIRLHNSIVIEIIKKYIKNQYILFQAKKSPVAKDSLLPIHGLNFKNIYYYVTQRNTLFNIVHKGTSRTFVSVC